ncbi:hypothetical protein BKA93DRAFT_778798 [Sparassis latifolia]
MSNNSTELRQFWAALRPFFARNPAQSENYSNASNGALLLYYHVLVLAQERECIWRRRKFTGVTMLYIMNKFGSVGWAICNLLSIPNWGSVNVSLSKVALFYVFLGSDLVMNLTSTVFDSLRVYAIGGRSWRYAVVVAVLNSTFLLPYICVGVYIGYLIDAYDVSNAIRFIIDTPEFMSILNIASPMVLSSFILNLREIYMSDTSGLYSRPSFGVSRASDLRFASRIVGNIGAPLSLSVSSPNDGGNVAERNLPGDRLEDRDGDELSDDETQEVPRVAHNPLAADFVEEEYY